ncbi:hypothetical protein ACES2J_08345 [Bdellovibrio bacteriovorus]|uniref:phage adaptor protein n=1 Tax=Bdellovibrio bacteriovorus TaxID=959 RepID=UPI0035A6F55C
MGTTSSDLIANIKLKGSFPTASDLFSNADYLSVLNDEILNTIVPIINKVNEEYFLSYKAYAVTAGQEAYRIPKRAVGSTLRDIQRIDSAGSVLSLGRLFEEDRKSLTAGPIGYYLKSNTILLSPVPVQTSGTLRMAYTRRPSKLVMPSACAQVTAINGSVVDVASVPSTMTNNTLIDFVQQEGPYDILDMDVTITGISGTTINFASVPSDLAIGDYICLAGESCVPGVPEEMVPTLVQAALCVCLTSKKDKSAELEIQKLQQMKDSLVQLMEPRVKSSDVVVRSNILLNTFRRY